MDTQNVSDKVSPAPSLIMWFPNEVTGIVFNLAHKMAYSKIQESDEEPQRLPMEVILSHVCRHWRSVAFTLPILWASFSYEERKKSCLLCVSNRLETYLIRSKTQLLNLSFEFDSWKKDSDLLEKIIPHVARCRRLAIISRDNSMSNIQRQLKEISPPYLEYLSIHAEGSHMVGPLEVANFPQAAILQESPCLRSVKLRGKAFCQWLPPLSTITTLILEHPNSSALVSIPSSSLLSLLAMPTLENLSMSRCPWSQPYDLRPFPMHRLKHLRLSDDRVMFFVLPFIEAPLLESIMLQNFWMYFTWADFPMDHTFPSLRNLFITDCSCLHVLLSSMRNLSKSINHLTLSFNMCFDPTRTFTKYLADDPIWPELTTVSLNLQDRPNYLPIIKACTKRPGLTLRIHQSVQGDLTRRHPEVINTLQEMGGTIETLDGQSLNAGGSWPSQDDPVETDVDDNNIFYIPSYH